MRLKFENCARKCRLQGGGYNIKNAACNAAATISKCRVQGGGYNIKMPPATRRLQYKNAACNAAATS